MSYIDATPCPDCGEPRVGRRKKDGLETWHRDRPCQAYPSPIVSPLREDDPSIDHEPVTEDNA